MLLLVAGELTGSVVFSSDTLTVFPEQKEIRLKDKYILPSTVRIECLANDSLKFDSLQIQSMDGVIRGFFLPTDTLIVVIGYQHLDFAIPQQVIINPPPRLYVGSESKISRQSKSPTYEIKTSTDYDFLKSGTVYRGVRLGSAGGLSLQSGLNLELEGKISEDISVIGALSDQNIPIQPEGNTQTLDEIDKVFIKVKMPHEDITFGDYELSQSVGKLGSYRRKLQGIYIHSKRSSSNVSAAGAVTKGQYNSNFFNGEESNQGPYSLNGKNGETAIIVLAGTEKIWIDGKLKTRGENSDYIIDYSTGEVTFMPRCLITSDSRITVDFQYTDLVYSKNIWIARSETKINNEKLRLSAGVISEKDDKNNPIEILLSDDDKSLLREAGDNFQLALQNTIREDSAGSYNLRDSILVFQGQGQGTYSATFYNIGKKGTYRKIYQGDYFYFEWIDKDDPGISNLIKEQAVYFPGKPIKPAQQQRLYHFLGDWNPTKGVTVKSEFARSDFDINIFSAKDDRDNAGNSVNIEASYRLPETSFGNITLWGNFLSEDMNFNPIDRHNSIEYRREWDLPSDSTQGEKVYRTRIDYKLKDLIKWNVEVGNLSKYELDSRRYMTSLMFKYRWLKNASFSQENISRMGKRTSSRDWVRRRGALDFDLLDMNPFFEIEYEKRENDKIDQNNFRFTEQRYGIRSDHKGRFKWGIENRERNDDVYSESKWIRNTVAQTLIIEGRIINWKNISSEWSYTRRKREYKRDTNTPDVNFHLLYFRISQALKIIPIRYETNMKVEEERTVKKEWQYFYVGMILSYFEVI